MENPYLFPDDDFWRVINVSGGRTSAYMLRQTLDAYSNKLPRKCVCVFCNTGQERSRTLDFLQQIQENWNVKIYWIEYEYKKEREGGWHNPRSTYNIVDRESASILDNSPFEKMLKVKKFVPSLHNRICTSNLKVEPLARFMYHEFHIVRTRFINLLGIRYDEPQRWGEALLANCKVEYPLVHAGVTEEDVNKYWSEESKFDLQLESKRGNCNLCFLKGKQNLIETIREDPYLVDWWIEMEEKHERQFSDRHSYRELKELSEQDDLVLDFVDNESFDCFCTS